MNVSIIRRPSPFQDLAWIAPQPASFYVQGGGGYGAVNRDAMEAIAQTFSGIWEDVEMVFMMHAQCTFPCTDPSTQSNCEYTCPWGGVQGLALPTPVTDFNGLGTTQRYLYWPNVNTDLNRKSLPWIAAHEYGHWLRFDHTAGSDAPNANERVNPGKYDVMRSSASGVSGVGLVPYSSLLLSGTQLGGGWVPRQVIVTDTEGLRVPDVRGPQAVIYQVPIPGANQSFILSNHQATTPYDAKYGRNGLIIWHEFRSSFGTLKAWDIESAAGKFTGGQPDPVSGKDLLEADLSFPGSAADIFDGVERTHFACGTNPNTNLYSGDVYSAPQSIPTSVAFESIRRDPATGDMLVECISLPSRR